MTHTNLHFSKFHGTGNDFVMIDNRNRHFKPENEHVAKLCDRHFGVGADGLILIEEHPELDFTMRYFNADGKESTMCGNGGRCAVAFAKMLNMVRQSSVRFMASDGEHIAMIKDTAISLKMQDVSKVEKHDSYMFADTGSPHYVTFADDLNSIDVVSEGRKIRYSKPFQPGGTNVNFVRVMTPDRIFNRTYERGVENETLSCGTGSVAAAICAASLRQDDSNVMKVRTLGGELTVRYRKDASGGYRDIWLEGPAQHVFDGTFRTDNLHYSTEYKPTKI